VSTTRITRHLNAPPERVYRALIDPQAIAEWRVPEGMKSHVHEHDAREGGAFRVSLTYDAANAAGKTSAHADTYHGRFVKLVPGIAKSPVRSPRAARSAEAPNPKMGSSQRNSRPRQAPATSERYVSFALRGRRRAAVAGTSRRRSRLLLKRSLPPKAKPRRARRVTIKTHILILRQLPQCAEVTAG